MESIEADLDGLIALGGACQREADGLRVIRGQLQDSPSFQSTSVAMQKISAVVSRAETLISVRLQVTGHKFATAAEWLGARESTSRREIAATGDELTAE